MANSFFQRKHLRAAYRSGLESLIAASLASAGCAAQFEPFKVPFEQPAKSRTYLPDFLLPNGVLIETKGQFTLEDRQKHEWLREQHPDLSIRFVFSNAKAKLSKGSPTTYADWCDKRGFMWSHKTVPISWLTEPENPTRTAAVAALVRTK